MYHYISSELKAVVNGKEVMQLIETDVYSVRDNLHFKYGVNKKTRGKFNQFTEYHCSYPMAFDIETTKYNDKDVRAMYIWQFAVDTDYVIIGRTWEEFLILLEKLNKDGRIFHIFVHNLTYEFVFSIKAILSEYTDVKVKLLRSRNIWEMQIKNCIFHDSLAISGMSLERTTYDFNRKYFKAVGDLDYNKRFNINTRLTMKELGYCILDVLSLNEYINVLMNKYNCKLMDMPKTRTGFVRRALRNACNEDSHYHKWFIETALNPYTYKLCKLAYEGGFCAGDIRTKGEIINHKWITEEIGHESDIFCFDRCSAYPFEMLAEYYPITKWEEHETDTVTLEDLCLLLETKCVIATYTFFNVKLKDKLNAPRISASKCEYTEDTSCYNGKIVSASVITKTMTEVAFKDFCNYYDFTDFTWDNVISAERGDMAEPFLEMTRKYFSDKTTLKGIDGKELEYLLSKGDLNGLYGMISSALVREEWGIDLETLECDSTQKDVIESLNSYYDSKNSFAPYQWACYVTSWSRHHIFTIMDLCYDDILEKSMWLYTDTDSVYFIMTDNILSKIKAYNESLPRPYSAMKPNGKLSILGQLEPDGVYTEFRQWGAKKYCKREKESGKLIITVAGVPKKNGAKCLHDNIREFTIGKNFDGKTTGKKRPIYDIQPYRQENVNGVMTWTGCSIELVETDYVLSDVDSDLETLNIISDICEKGFTEVFEEQNYTRLVF